MLYPFTFCFRTLNLSYHLKATPVVILVSKLSQNPKVLIKKLSILMIAEIKIEKIIIITINKDESNNN